jgi:hypothetical protein
MQCVIDRCRKFAKTSNARLSEAVDAENKLAQGRFVLARPAIDDSHALYANDPNGKPSNWLWELDTNAAMSPEDDVRSLREPMCDKISDRFTRTICRLASGGHPNREGERAIAQSILNALVIARQ